MLVMDPNALEEAASTMLGTLVVSDAGCHAATFHSARLGTTLDDVKQALRLATTAEATHERIAQFEQIKQSGPEVGRLQLFDDADVHAQAHAQARIGVRSATDCAQTRAFRTIAGDTVIGCTTARSSISIRRHGKSFVHGVTCLLHWNGQCLTCSLACKYWPHLQKIGTLDTDSANVYGNELLTNDARSSAQEQAIARSDTACKVAEHPAIAVCKVCNCIAVKLNSVVLIRSLLCELRGCQSQFAHARMCWSS
jgi:hypothetical protein